MASMENACPRTFNTLFNKRDYANTNRPEADLDVFS